MPGALIVYIHCNDIQMKGSACRRICILCQQISRKRWFGKMKSSNCDVTNSTHQIQMTTLCHWMKPPWKFSAYATATTIETLCICDRTSLEVKCQGPFLKWRFSAMTTLSHLLMFGPFQRRSVHRSYLLNLVCRSKRGSPAVSAQVFVRHLT